jgi:hypothetical protein
MKQSRPLYAAIYPGQRAPTLAGTYEAARDAWADCLDQMVYRAGFGFRPGTRNRAHASKLGYRVVKVRLVPAPPQATPRADGGG